MRTMCGMFNVDVNDSKAWNIIQKRNPNMISVEGSSCSWNYNYDIGENQRLMPDEFDYLKDCLKTGKIKISY